MSTAITSAAPATLRLARTDYLRLTRLVYDTCGIELNSSKQQMVESRLRKRLAATGLPNFKAYWKFLTEDKERDEELVRLIDVITTNKTEFFREPRHFDFLLERILPHVPTDGTLKVWSAGCSTGKEAYTLAMLLSECVAAGKISDFSILGTDICTDVLQEARLAIYPESDLESIPVPLRKRYLLRSRDRKLPTFRMASEIRGRVTWQRLNFMDLRYGFTKSFDVILCRNVMIYFDRPTQEAVVNRLSDCLIEGGYFFIGHSETLNGLSTGLEAVAPAVYRKGQKVMNHAEKA